MNQAYNNKDIITKQAHDCQLLTKAFSRDKTSETRDSENSIAKALLT